MPGPLRRSVLAASLVLILVAVARPAAPPVVEPPRLDAVGDPLPDDALVRFGTARFRDPTFQGGVALSPDGKLLAVPGAGEIRLLDAITGNEVRRIKGQSHSFHHGTIVFSSNSKVLALSDHSSIVVCDVVKAEVIGQFKPTGRLGQGLVSFSRDGKLLAVGGRGFREKLAVTLWDVAARKEKKKIETAHDHQVHAVLSPDGKSLAVWGQNLQRREAPVLRMLDVETGKERYKLESAGYFVQHLVFSPDGKQMATVERGLPPTIRDAATGKPLRQFAACANTTLVMYSPDGAVLATGAANGTVQLWDARSGRRLGQCKAPPQTSVGSIGFLPGNRVLAAGFAHQLLRLWDVPSGRERTPGIGHLAAVSSLAFSRDGKTLFSAAADGVRVHALASGKELHWIEPPQDEYGRFRRGFNRSASFLSPHGRWVVWSDQIGRGMTVMDLSSREEIANIGSMSTPFGAAVAFAPDGADVATLGMEIAGKVRQTTADVWDLESGLLRCKLKVPAVGHAWSLALSPGGKMLVLAVSQQFGNRGADPVALWDVAAGKETARLAITSAECMTFSPDGSVLATSGNEGVSLHDASNGRMILRLEGAPRSAHTPLAFSPDGRTLAVASKAAAGETDEIRLWELASGKVRAAFPGCRGGTQALAFSPDGRTLASGGADTTVMLWDATGIRAAARRRTGKPTAAQWADLDSADPRKAREAMARLELWPAETLALLGKELKPVPGKPPAAKEVQRLIADLDADSFEVRQKATRKLSEAGLAVRSALFAALAGAAELEKKRRLEELLRAVQPGLLAESIRAARALEVLERLAGAEARRLVQTLAGGNPGARLTVEAETVLKRMDRKP